MDLEVLGKTAGTENNSASLLLSTLPSSVNAFCHCLSSVGQIILFFVGWREVMSV